MKIGNKILVLFLITMVGSSCDPNSFDNCKCTELKIYGIPSGILTPITISREDIMNGAPVVVSDKDSIDEVISMIQNLNKIEAMDGIDNRFVIAANCKGSRDVIFGSNNYISRIGNNYLKPSSEFLELVSTYTSNRKEIK